MSIERLVRLVNPEPKTENDRKLPLSSVFERFGDVILLGDPGAGKSHSLRVEAKRTGAHYIRARDFLNDPTIEKGQRLLIDGLDEKRSGHGDQDTIDAMVKKLFEVEPSSVCITCRAVDWLGESDLAAFGAYFQKHGGVGVVELLPLSRQEQCAVVAAADIDDPEAFLDEAETRKLDTLISNPQTLIMLSKVVKAGSWPQTRRELFEQATALLLDEFNSEHGAKGSGTYLGSELRDAAGALFAIRLISDVGAISSTEQSIGREVPSYRTAAVLGIEPEKLKAASTRLVFSSVGANKVDYVHRVLAEYLAAEWLAKLVRGGLPLCRLRSTLGVDGRPTIELRGLHAWLVVHLGDQGMTLIDADPFGTLVYGDVASLSPTAKRRVLHALAELSKENPWFRFGYWTSDGFGGLVDASLVGDFKSILGSSTNYSLRSIVLDALAEGVSRPELIPELKTILEDMTANSSERFDAVRILQRLGGDGEKVIRDHLASARTQQQDRRLRCFLLRERYDLSEGASDVVALLKEAQETDEEVGTDFVMLSDAIPDQDVATILDQVSNMVDLNKIEGPKNGRRVGSMVGRLLVRHIDAGKDASDEQWWSWLQAYQAMHGRFTGGRDEELKTRIQQDKGLQQRVVRHGLDRFEVDDKKWHLIHDLRELGQFAIDEQDLRSWIIDYIEVSEPGEKRNLLYELALILNAPDNNDHGQVCVRLKRLAESDPGLHEIGESVANREPQEWEKKEAEREAKWERKKAAQEKKRKEDFDRDRPGIRSGEHGGWMQWLGQVYFSRFYDVDEAVRPDQRLATLTGEDGVDDCLEGFIAYSKGKGKCDFAEVLTVHKEGQWRPIWLAFVAGLDERSKHGEDVTETLTKDELAAALAIDLMYTLRRGGTEFEDGAGWQAISFKRYPELAYDTYLAIACSDIAQGKNHIDGLQELLTNKVFADRRGETAMKLLEDYSNLSLSDVERLLLTALEDEAVHSRLVSMADEIASGRLERSPEERWRWLVAAYLVDQAKYGDLLRAEAKTHKDVIWIIREFAGYERVTKGQKKVALPASELAELAVVVGETFPPVDRPSSSSGIHNNWNGSEFFGELIDEISSGVSQQETVLLERLTDKASLSSYRDRILFSLANQKAQRREVEFDQPGWDATLKTIANKEPANIADLHALVDEQLAVIAEEIATGNTDAFKRFWNENKDAKPTTAKIEESCRDVLLDMLRQKLMPLGIVAEPEGHMALDKRADIAVFFGDKKVVIEIKRDSHSEVWRAITDQLERFYTRDHQCSGHGVFGVFWFGEKRTGSITLNPETKTRPSSASELKQMLEESLDKKGISNVTISVIDVSGKA